VDRDIWNPPAQKMEAVLDLRPRGDRPRALRRGLIPKSTGKLRPLGIPTMRERALQALSLLALAPIAETTAAPHSYGCRQERCSADAMMQGYSLLARQGSAQWGLEGDSTSCCDTISHAWLLTHVPMDKGVLRKWLTAGDMEKHAFYPPEAGTPHGGLASPVLATRALAGLERGLKAHFPTSHGETADRHQVPMVRDADDCSITGTAKERLAGEGQPCVEQCMKERGLELSQEQTVVTCVDNGFDCLGHHVRQSPGTYMAKPSRKNVHAFLEKVRSLVKAHQQAKVAHLIGVRNPVIRAGAPSHRHDARKATFGAVDAAIFKGWWPWARRRPPKKNTSGVKANYVHTQGDRRWGFSGQDVAVQGNPRPVGLFSASKMPLKRPRKIKAGAHPYDPAWAVYFAQRLGVKMETHLAGTRTLLHLCKDQGGICPVCHQPSTESERWHRHHLIWRTKGGRASVANLVLLHSNWHRQVHHRDLTVVKPCPAKGKREA
jgi:RNA-directed DNA polymerase